MHAPHKEGDPYDVPMLDSLGFSMRMVEGVIHVFEDSESASNMKPIEWPYPDRDSFLSEMNIMLALISDGPL